MKYGLTQERYTQMMRTYNNDKEMVKEIVDDWGAELCNKGYDIFDYDATGLLEIEAINDVGAFDSDEAAARQAAEDGIAIIPVEELPAGMPEDMRYFGWIDTEENRANLLEEFGNKKTFYVTYRFEARYVVEVEAENLEEAMREANAEYLDADFGDAEDIDGEAIMVEDEDGNYVWEK